jgi:TonB family protein
MNAIAARWESEQVRLWTGSALAALLVHLVPAGLLILYLHWPARPSALAGSPAVLDVELASLPSPPSPAPSLAQPPRAPPQPPTRQPPARPLPLAAVNPVQPLGPMPSLPQPETVPSSAVPVAHAAATSAPAESSGLGTSGASSPQLQLWKDEIVARLASYKAYPKSAIREMQHDRVSQDTVTLQFSVDHAGRVTSSQIDSTHHYQPLEQEVQQMLRLAGRLPAPPAQLSNDDVVTVPVQFDLIKRKVAPARPTLASCTAAASPGPAPTGSTATLEQMRAYRERLNQYLAAAGSQLTCLSQVREASALPLRNTLTRQLRSMVDEFNAEARVVEANAQAQAQAQALQAKQARQRQAQALAAQLYDACARPAVPQAPGALSAKDAPSFRRQLLADQSAVRSYVACLQKAELAAAAPDRGLAGDQRAQLAQTALQRGNAAIQAFNQLAGRFNAQVPHLQQQALAALAQRNLAEALVRATAIFPNSSWSVPAPLPADECVRIARSGQSYRAQICESVYVTDGIASAIPPHPTGMELATLQEHIAAIHGVGGDPRGGPPILGIAVAPLSQAGQQTAGRVYTTHYSVSDLQVSGRRVSMTISRKSDQDAGTDDVSAVHFDLVLSPDHQTLRGYCWTGQQRSVCTLTRHASSSGPENSHH